MAELDSKRVAGPGEGGWFPSTHWSLVLHAGKDSSPDARAAFGRLYEVYRPPLLAYLRFTGRPANETDDLLQGFFEALLEGRRLSHVRRLGKFRSWLLTCLKHYVSDLWDRARADKRGGGARHVPIEADPEAEGVEPAHPGRTPDEEFDRQFALCFLEQVMGRLEQEYRAKGKGRSYDHLHPFLLERKGALSHAELGRQLGMSQDYVSQEISRLRKAYRELFDDSLLQLVGDPAEIEGEKTFLLAALRS